MKIVAFNYRLAGDPKGDRLQGHWKEFDNKIDAWSWCEYRANKTPDSPKGVLVVLNIEGLKSLQIACNDKIYPDSLNRALISYLKWSKIKI